MPNSEIAAWVQAGGSILTIVAAFYISSKQFADATEMQRQAMQNERRRQYETLIGLVEAALADFADIVKALRSSDPQKWFEENSSRELMDEFYQAFIQISPLDMPSAIAARALVTFRDRLKTAAWNANAAIERGTSDFKEYMNCVEAMEHNLNEIQEEIVKLVVELKNSEAR